MNKELLFNKLVKRIIAKDPKGYRKNNFYQVQGKDNIDLVYDPYSYNGDAFIEVYTTNERNESFSVEYRSDNIDFFIDKYKHYFPKLLKGLLNDKEKEKQLKEVKITLLVQNENAEDFSRELKNGLISEGLVELKVKRNGSEDIRLKGELDEIKVKKHNDL